MQITIEAAALREALAGNVAGKGRNALPIHEHVLLAPGDGALQVVTTDRVRTRWARAAATVEEATGAAVHLGILQGALAGLEGPLTLSDADGGPVVLRQGRRRYALPTVDAQEFPLPPEAGKRTVLACDAVTLRAAIERVSYAAAVEDVRYFLMGVCIEAQAVVATDGHRLAAVLGETGLAEGAQAILPREALRSITPMLVEGACVELVQERGHATNAIEISSAHGVLRVQLIGGVYPDWRRLLPQGVEAMPLVVCEGAPLRATLGRAVSVVDNPKAPIGRFFTAGGELCVDARGGEDAVDAVPCEGELPAEVGMNIRYLGDLAALDGSLRWRVNAPDAAQLFELPSHPQDRHLVMPARI